MATHFLDESATSDPPGDIVELTGDEARTR